MKSIWSATTPISFIMTPQVLITVREQGNKAIKNYISRIETHVIRSAQEQNKSRKLPITAGFIVTFTEVPWWMVIWIYVCLYPTGPILATGVITGALPLYQMEPVIARKHVFSTSGKSLLSTN